MTAKAVLICRPNSHPFQERTLYLDQPVKIGRSVARARPAPNNAIFDCKVLSRNHALLWYENGKFYLQDTKSSNGTFVNNQRLSKGAEESPPREVCSADIVQFGVDVMENTRKVTHGCIVATLKLYLADGKEAKASPSTTVVSSVGSVPLEDMYQLKHFIQECLHREQLLENKLATMQSLVSNMVVAVDKAWKALIEEDRLLSKIELLENQLLTCSKNFPEDKVREEVRRLLEEKDSYQAAAKEALKKVVQEKVEAVVKLKDIERALSNSEDECALLRNSCDQNQKDCQDLAQKYKLVQQTVEELAQKLKESEEQQVEAIERLEQEKIELEACLQERQDNQNRSPRIDLCNNDEQSFNDSNSKTKLDLDDTIDLPDGELILKKIEDVPEITLKEVSQFNEEVEKLKQRLEGMEEDLHKSQQVVDDLIEQLKNTQMEIDLRDKVVVDLQERIQLTKEELAENTSNDVKSNKVPDEDEVPQSETVNKLKQQLEELQECLESSLFHVEFYKSMVVVMSELLEEARDMKRSSDAKVTRLQNELDTAQLECKKLTEESEVLRGHIQGGHSPGLRLEQQMLNLVSSSQTLQAQYMQLQSVLQEATNRARLRNEEVERLRRQLMESQQNEKQCRNEAEKMKDVVKNLEEEVASCKQLSGKVLQEDNKKNEELQHSQQECKSLQHWISVMEDELKTLKMKHLQLEEENKTLKASVSSKDSKSVCPEPSGDFSAEDESNLDISEITKQQDFVKVMQLYLSCKQRKAEMSNDLERLKEENTRLENRSTTGFLFGVIPLMLLVWALILRIQSSLAFFTATFD
ncbi:sarcolemmal membrane-associated protein isoform X2 [Neocloeon triangulifer]|uniref:sarcolemmal membrane-associated protein isoform X2 n=1 Tax=Neocloeon triangulifer TaxID=2078957 RepID=UPI00286F24E1|nr:sarcolemmal membrane-associated protein isoform X2 [Neocloeon triangulifer]